jgi:murein DD-endopeptidase MepM/ murein hydrolase activator NlpD
MKEALVALLTAAFALMAGVARAGPPWERRVGRDVDERHNLSYQSISPEAWPEEPGTPEVVDPDRFREALGRLCPPMPPDRLAKYSGWVRAEAERFEVDPFLLGALVHDRSECRPKTPDDSELFGLTRIDLRMHAPHVRGGEYRYFVQEDGAWGERRLPVPDWPFNKWKAAKAVSNLYWTAALLRVWREQHADLDAALGGVPHRHHVSHWFYGDVVRGTEPEDRVLTIRRRLLAYYHDGVPQAAGTCMGRPLVSPLDGVPRLVIDWFGNPRGKKGGAGHQGIDLSGLVGEPVRSVADGRVVFAGVDLPGQGGRQLTPKEAGALRGRKLGPAGFYVAVNHGEGLRSYYMHLDALAVRDWQEVRAGEVIGTLGRSGTVSSGPHLHLEFRVGTDRIDPAVPLAKALVNPFAERQ